jgi:hypothetical protein
MDPSGFIYNPAVFQRSDVCPVGFRFKYGYESACRTTLLHCGLKLLQAYVLVRFFCEALQFHLDAMNGITVIHPLIYLFAKWGCPSHAQHCSSKVLVIPKEYFKAPFLTFV